MRYIYTAVLFSAAFFFSTLSVEAANKNSFLATRLVHKRLPNPKGYKLFWHEEFHGTQLDDKIWSYENGDGCNIGLCGWGNGELQTYTSDAVKVENGNLVINAYLADGKWYSGKIISRGKFEFTYGRVDVRAKLPSDNGPFPAIWMLGTNGAWPQCGEIDITEFQAAWQTTPQTLHFQNRHGGPKSSPISFTVGNFAGKWATYSVIWAPNKITFLINNKVTGVYENPGTGNDDWPYDNSFYFLVNLAIKPSWGVPPDQGVTNFKMLVSSIRVYRPVHDKW